MPDGPLMQGTKYYCFSINSAMFEVNLKVASYFFWGVFYAGTGKNGFNMQHSLMK